MTLPLLLYSVLVWLILAVLAVANGTFRALFLTPWLGDLPAGSCPAQPASLISPKFVLT